MNIGLLSSWAVALSTVPHLSPTRTNAAAATADAAGRSVIRPRQPISVRSTADYCHGFGARPRVSFNPGRPGRPRRALQLISERSKQRKSFSRGFRMPIHHAVLRNMTDRAASSSSRARLPVCQSLAAAGGNDLSSSRSVRPPTWRCMSIGRSALSRRKDETEASCFTVESTQPPCPDPALPSAPADWHMRSLLTWGRRPWVQQRSRHFILVFHDVTWRLLRRRYHTARL